MSPTVNALNLIVGFVFNIYIVVLLLRLLLQKFGASWNNPITKFLVTVTDPVVKPVSKFIPSVMGFDLGIVVIVFVLETLKAWILLKLQVGVFPGILGAIVVALAHLIGKVLNIFLYGTIINAIMSWLPGFQSNLAGEIIHVLTEPVLKLFRRIIPTISGFDLSPIGVILACLLLNVLVINIVISIGLRLAY